MFRTMNTIRVLTIMGPRVVTRLSFREKGTVFRVIKLCNLGTGAELRNMLVTFQFCCLSYMASFKKVAAPSTGSNKGCVE